MKRLLKLALIPLVIVGIAGLWCLRVRRNQEQACVNHMRMLQSAAVSYCLEHRLGPDSVLKVADLAEHVGPDIATCPVGGIAYPSLFVLQGPSCPNGQPFRPGEPRPLRAADPKTAGLYRNAGLTNRIDEEVQSTLPGI